MESRPTTAVSKRPEPVPPRPLRVLYVSPFAEPISGPDESLLLLLSRLGPRIEPTVVLPPGSPFFERYRMVGARVIELPVSRLARFGRARDVLDYVGRFLRTSARLFAYGTGDFDLVHLNMEVCLEAALVGRLWRVPVVIHYRGNTNDEPKPVFDVLTRVWTTLGDHVFTISEPCAGIFRRRGRGDRVEVLHNGVDLERFAYSSFERARIRKALALRGDDKVVITLGRLHPRKDPETLLRAAAEIDDAIFLLVGEGFGEEGRAYERSLRALVDDLGLGARVRFLGARSDIPSLLAAADVFVMTSRHEGFGRAAAEAMAVGLPCVLTREGAFPDLIVEGASGLLAEPGDPSSFARAIGAVLADPVARKSMGENAAGRARALFDADAHARRVLDVYEALVKTKE